MPESISIKTFSQDPYKDLPVYSQAKNQIIHYKKITFCQQVLKMIMAIAMTVFTLGIALMWEYTRLSWREAMDAKHFYIVNVTQTRKPSYSATIVPSNIVLKVDGMPPDIAKKLTIIDRMINDLLPRIYFGIGKWDAPKAVDLFNEKLTQEEKQLLMSTYTEILKEFMEPRYQAMYGIQPFEFRALPKVGQPVPQYLASGVDQKSNFLRKAYSIAGLGNLISQGAPIWDELAEKLFHAGEFFYVNGRGLRRMKDWTGNTVDLEQTAKDWDHAKELIDGFKLEFADFKEEFPKRDIELPPKGSPIFNTNSPYDKGFDPIWRFNGKLYVNVPRMGEVFQALFKGPLLFAQSYLILKSQGKNLDAFFDESLSMLCFNAKMNAIQEFNEKVNGVIYPKRTPVISEQQKMNAINFYDHISPKLTQMVQNKEWSAQTWISSNSQAFINWMQQQGHFSKLYREGVEGNYTYCKITHDTALRMMRDFVAADAYGDYFY